MKIGIVWEHGVSKWTMAPFEELLDKHDVTVFVGEKKKFSTEGVRIPQQALTRHGELRAALADPAFALAHLRTPYKRFYFYINSLRAAVDDSFDVMICGDGSRSLNTLATLKPSRRYKLVVSYSENIPVRSIFDAKTDLIKKRAWSAIDLLTPWCEHIRLGMEDEGVTPPIQTIPMGICQDIFQPREKDHALCAQYGLDPDKFIFSYIGKLVSWKGVQYLLYAAKVLKRQGRTNFQIAITGRGAQLDNLKKIIADLGLQEEVVFTGFLPYTEVGRLHNLADCLVLPSVPTLTWQEQFGMVLVEAMACRKPILGSRSGAIPEVSAGASLLHTPGDWRELATDMARLLDDPALCAQLGETGYRRVCERYTKQHTARQYEAALLRLLAAG